MGETLRKIHNITSKVCLILVLSGILGTSALAASVILWPLTGNALIREITDAEPSSVTDPIKAARISFAKEHSCKDPEGIVDAIGESELADILLSTAIEESHCDKEALGTSGEQGAWQVIGSEWGPVPKDLRGQARQAERIIRGLLIDTKGKPIKAMARYNGGDLPGIQSVNYARRVTSREQKLASLVRETRKSQSNEPAS